MATGLNLKDVNDSVVGIMQQSEQTLLSTLTSLGDGSTASVTDLVGLQYVMSVYTITGQTISAIMKEASDAMKSVVQKI